MRWDGLFRAVYKLSETIYVLRKIDSNKAFVVHVNRLKPWKERLENNHATSTEEKLTTGCLYCTWQF